MKKTLITRLIIGFVAGAITIHVITMLANYLESGSLLVCRPDLIEVTGLVNGFILQTILGGVLGMLGFGGMCFFDIEEWSLLRATVLHCALILFAYLTIGSLLHWFSFHITSILIMTSITILVYLIIWLIMYVLWKREIREMNRLTEEYKREAEENEK